MDVRASARLLIKSAACAAESPGGGFGHGCALLLEGVERERSLNAAAKTLGMAYSKAWKLIREAEEHLGCKLLTRDGARGSRLTADGRKILIAYRALQSEVDKLIAARLPELLGTNAAEATKE